MWLYVDEEKHVNCEVIKPQVCYDFDITIGIVQNREGWKIFYLAYYPLVVQTHDFLQEWT